MNIVSMIPAVILMFMAPLANAQEAATWSPSGLVTAAPQAARVVVSSASGESGGWNWTVSVAPSPLAQRPTPPPATPPGVPIPYPNVGLR